MRSSRVTAALLLGALVGLALGVIVKGQLDESDAPSTPEISVPEPVEALQEPERDQDPVARAALDYAHALQENDWEDAITRVWWMRERLERAAATGEDRDEAKRDLVRRISDRNPAANRLRRDGIADQYVFQPGTRVKFLLADEGEEDLEPPAVGRAWLRVTFTKKETAPLSPDGLPIKSLVAGVNVDADGNVLKANISGNLSIDDGSISLDWE